MALQDMEVRFHDFARGLPAAESIDDLLVADPLQGQRADYLWRDRSVVVELKTLTEDPQGKIDSAVQELSKRPDFPVFIGPAPMDKVLRHIPDGAEVMRKLNQAMLRSIEGAFRSAKHQIANTKRLFDLEDPLGLLVVLNPAIETLEPSGVVQELSRQMERRQTNGWSVDAVWLLSEAHRMSGAHPCLIITGSRIDRFDWAGDYLGELNSLWAKFHNSPMIRTTPQARPNLAVDPKGPRPGEMAPNHEHWRAHYRASRYMESMGDDEVLALGRAAFAALLPYFLKGGPRVPMPQLHSLMVRWTEFLEEAAMRGLNMRGFAKDLKLPPGFELPPTA